MRNSSEGTWEAIKGASSLERTNLNQRSTKESPQLNFSLQNVLDAKAWNKFKKQRGKNQAKKFTVAIKYTDITFGLGSAGW